MRKPLPSPSPPYFLWLLPTPRFLAHRARSRKRRLPLLLEKSAWRAYEPDIADAVNKRTTRLLLTFNVLFHIPYCQFSLPYVIILQTFVFFLFQNKLNERAQSDGYFKSSARKRHKMIKIVTMDKISSVRKTTNCLQLRLLPNAVKNARDTEVFE